MSLVTSIAWRILLLCNCVHGILIYIANYEGNITVLSLTENSFASTGSSKYVEDGYFPGYAPATRYDLSVVETFKTPALNPQWMTLNHHNNILYLIDGVTTGNGSVTAYRTSSKNGTGLVELDSVECLLDGSFATFYANGKGLAVAHFTSSAIQTYDITASNGTIKPLQTFTYTMAHPGPGARQNAPHIHQTITDPLGEYLLGTDFGADLVRVYAIDDETLLLDKRESLNATKGSGPHHAVFSREPILFPDGVASYIFYLGAELAGTITAYRVTYLPERGGLKFKLLKVYSSLEPGIPKPDVGDNGITSEVQLTPDGNYIIVSNRFDQRYNGTKEQYPPNGTSDSISTFRVRKDLGGLLDFVQAAPAGGYVPRAMDLNAAGNLAAVGIQYGHRVSILERDLCTGTFSEQVATVEVQGQTWAVVWDN
ncbi:isomerase YbhE [Penicillium herquei]|nr:isomerase YbhE [Penicillium herquei]